MVRQAAEGLGADDIGVAAARKLQHFGSEQPALAHVVAVADNALGHSLRLFIGRRCAEGSGAQGFMQNAFDVLQVPHSALVRAVL